MLVEAWSPIVYGRTIRADSWWRATPDGLPHQDWLGMLVSAVVSGGDRLDRPRFLLARLNAYWVTGVACMAAEISSTFTSDAHRPLYTFVGWVAPSDVGNMPPALADLRGGYREWAGPLYQKWVGLDWEEHASKVREPHATLPMTQPWPQPDQAEQPDQAGEEMQLSVRPGEIGLWPAADEDLLWQAGLRSQSAFVLAVGWAGVHYVPRYTVTHATVDGLTEPEFVPAESGGLALTPGPDEAINQREPSLERPYLTIDEKTQASSESFVARMKDRVLGGEELAYVAIRIRILIVTSDNQVLVEVSDKGAVLPHGMVRRRELPSTACKRVARELLGLELVQATPISVTYYAQRNLLSITASCWLTTSRAQIRAQQGVTLELRSLDDPSLPDPIKTALERLEAGIDNPVYREREQ